GAELGPDGGALQDGDPGFTRYFRAGLGWAMDRFKAKPGRDQQRPNGGIGCFSPDNYPIIDFVRPNALLSAHPNHGFKLLGVRKEVAHLIVAGLSRSLQPFR